MRFKCRGRFGTRRYVLRCDEATDAVLLVGALRALTNPKPGPPSRRLARSKSGAIVDESRAGVHDDATVQLQRRMRLRVGELKNIDVHAEERGRGAGTVLLEEMVSVLRARGCRYCILRHLDASRPAAGFKKGGLIRWYEKHGFRLARDVLPKSLEFIDTDHMVAEVDQIYLRERAR